MIRSFCSADQLRRRSTVEIISDDMCLTVLKHVNKDSMIHLIPPRSARRQCHSPERTLTHWPSSSAYRLGTPNISAIRFTREETFEASWFTHLLRPASLLAPLYGSDRIAPAIGDFYIWASSGSVALPAARYDYNSDWTPLLAGLSPAGIAASFAAHADVSSILPKTSDCRLFPVRLQNYCPRSSL